MKKRYTYQHHWTFTRYVFFFFFFSIKLKTIDSFYSIEFVLPFSTIQQIRYTRKMVLNIWEKWERVFITSFYVPFFVVFRFFFTKNFVRQEEAMFTHRLSFSPSCIKVQKIGEARSLSERLGSAIHLYLSSTINW